MYCDEELIEGERRRIQAEYSRRAQEISTDLYAPWQPAEMLMRGERKRKAAVSLRRAGVFPQLGEHCLEVGFGALGWLGDLISWSVPETNLHGVELDPSRVRRAQELLPQADLRIGDATRLEWDSDTFQLVIASTVFTSILNQTVRRAVAKEITRVIKPGGALLWYDFAVNNPKNPHVRKVGEKELRHLFPQLKAEIQSVTLAPPLARLVAHRSWPLATFLESLPFLRTHLLGVLIKPL